MIAYYFFFILPAFGVISPIHIKKNLDSFFWFILILTYIFIIGFRYEVGGDWGTYVYTSNVMYDGGFNLFSFALRSDYGYELINWISLNLGLGTYGINLFCSVIFTTTLFYFCSLQPNKWLGIIIGGDQWTCKRSFRPLGMMSILFLWDLFLLIGIGQLRRFIR